MSDEDYYQVTKETLFQYMKRKKGPYEITLSFILRIFDTSRCHEKPLNEAFKIKERILKEFCTTKLHVPNDFSIETIKIIDDNINYMYSSFMEVHKRNPNVHRNILLISDEKIAALLRMVYGYKLICDE